MHSRALPSRISAVRWSMKRSASSYATAVALALIVLPQIVVLALAPVFGADAAQATQLLFFIAIIVSLAGQIALNRLAVGPSLTVGSAISRGFQRLLPLVAALLLVSIVL